MIKLNSFFILLILCLSSFTSHAASSLTITSAMVDGASSTTVFIDDVITAQITLTESQEWKSTRWIITDTTNSTITDSCHVNSSANSSSNTFNITAPSIYGTYDISFVAYKNEICSEVKGSALLLADGIIVGPENLIASYSFDQSDWQQTSIVIDDIGAHNGVVNGLVTRNESTSTINHPNTCSSASFSGGAIDISGLPVSTATGAKTSVSFWMYWDGTDNMMPLGFYRHDLWFTGGHFGFNSSNSDIFGIPSAGLANGWHHVAAVFTNTQLTNNELYIDGVKQTLTQLRSSPSDSFAVVSSSPRLGGWKLDNNYRFSGHLDEVKFYNGALSQAEVSADMNYIHLGTCPLDPPPLPPQPENLIASYSFNDNWSSSKPLNDGVGSANGIVSDSVSRVLAPPSGSKPETCAAGQFSGGAIDINALPVSITSGDKTSISFWMNWNGANSVMPLGWEIHDLWLTSGNFGFNTGGGDIYGISSAGLANSWHHVAVVFTNNNLLDNKIYIDGVEKVLTHRQGSIINSRAIVNPHLRLGGWWLNNSYRFQGQLDEIKIYTGEISPATVDINRTEISACATPLVTLHMDEISWNGTSNEVTDSSGNSHHGTSFNGAITQQLDSAISGDPGTCGTAQFDGIDDYIVLPTIPNLTSSFTFSAWVKSTKSSRGRIFADDDRNQGGFALSLNEPSSGKLRFYSRAVRPVSLDTSSVVLPQDDNWYFVTAVHDATTKQRIIYIDGIVKASGTYSGTWGTDSGSVSIGSETNASSEGVSFAAFGGNIDEAQIFDGALTQTQIQDIMDDTHPCNVVTEASNFNCVATGDNLYTGRLFTKLTNQDFTVDVAALQDATTLATSYANTVTVELVDASSGSCATYSALSPAISQSLNFTAGTGVKTSAVINSDRAYRNLKCRVTDNTYASPIVGCSRDAFAIRPPSLTISSPLTNTNSSGAPIAKAGANFQLTATTGTLNYDGIPVIIPARIEPHLGAVRTGDIAGAFPPADLATGNSIGTAFTYSEVGNIRFLDNAIVDSSFAAIDQSAGDCLNNSSNSINGDGKIGCNIANLNTSAYFGRFVPDHFEMTINNSGSFGGVAHACTNFNYVGQSFTYNSKPEIKVTAYNALSPQSITQNYTGNYAKLAISNFTITAPTTDANKLGTDTLNKVNLIWTEAAADLVDNGNGSHTYTFGDDDITYLQQTNSLVAPFTNAVEFEFIDISDSDNVASTNLPQSVTPSGASIRFGRLNINNVHGSELSPLTMPVITEYFNGSNWSVNTIDNCTNLALTSNILLNNPASGSNRPGNTAMIIESSSSTASLLNTPFSSGQGNLNFSAPGEDNQGYIDVKGELTGFEWLQFDWNSDGSFSETPSGRVSFGLYNGSDRLIFRREVY